MRQEIKLKTIVFISITSMCILISLPLFSQIRTDSLILLVKYKDNTNILRWAPTNVTAWQSSLSEGYNLSRANYLEGVSYENLKFDKVGESPIKKWTESQWNNYAASNTNIGNEDSIKYAYLAWDLTKSDLLLSGKENLEEMMKFRQSLEMKSAFGLMAADQSWTGALIQGLAYEDKNIQAGKTYIYKLEFVNKKFSNKPVFVIAESKPEPESLNYKVDLLELDQSLSLKWSSKILSSGYYIEISEDNKIFKRVNKTPYYPVTADRTEMQDAFGYKIDSLKNDKLYYLRVYGKTPFAETFLIGETKGKPKDLTPPSAPIIVNVKHIEEQKASIKWEMIEPLDDDLEGYTIGRSNNPFGVYKQINEGLVHIDQREFSDISFDKDSVTYYIIEAVDRNGNRSKSNFGHLALVDSTAPAKPIHIKSKMDSLGIVTINLEHQKEKDFMGYRIYKANAEDHEFSVVQETYNDTIVFNARNPVIIDTSTLESLTKYIYYKVTALDYHYNESKFSALIKVPRPDKIPPVPPLINDYVTTDKEIRLSITASSSSDVRQNYLYRKKDTDKEWLLLDSLGLKNAEYSDLTAENNVFYHYTVGAVDDSGLKSEFGNVIRIRTYYKPRPLDMTIFCTYFTADKQTLVTWKLNESIKEQIVFEMYDLSSNAEKNIGRASPATPDIFVFKTDMSPEIIGIKAYTETKEYLISEGPACIISGDRIEKDEGYKKYQKSVRHLNSK